MHITQIFYFLACAQVAITIPLSTQDRAGNQPDDNSCTKQSPANNSISKDRVLRTTENFAQNAEIVSNSLNTMTRMTDQDVIKETAQRGYDAEAAEDAFRTVLATAAGDAGNDSNAKLMKNGKTMLNGLKAIVQDPSPESVRKNVETMENVRNAEILPSITGLSNAALGSMGLKKTAQTLEPTTGSGASNNKNTGGNGDSNKGGPNPGPNGNVNAVGNQANPTNSNPA